MIASICLRCLNSIELNEATNKDNFVELHDRFQRGDIIGIVGYRKFHCKNTRIGSIFSFRLSISANHPANFLSCP
jgi:hypothetical protein